ncbi:MAG: PilT/PilU family type 4a pilus ATPase [Gammaproteobacteria bacterium]|nr:PilT/PilU family type 4a pilus ATPase [Gammaproteobacteria bacterium]
MNIKPFLELMVKESASDTYFSTGAPASMKIQGKLTAVSKQNLTNEQIKAAAFSVINDKQKKEFEEELELNFAISEPGVGRFRANLFIQRGNWAMVIRRINTEIPLIEDLKLPPILSTIIENKFGLILVVGATGSGKSTTLASMIGHRNRTMAGHILTIEDPVEFVHQHNKSIVNQREVGVDTRSYSNALKSSLREAPDVILIGEIRDAETMEHALTFANTGHLCLSTLHSTNASQTLDRIFGFFEENEREQVRDDLSRNLCAIISQRLVPGIDGKLNAAVEVLLNTSFVSNIIKKNEMDKMKDAFEQGIKDGMQSFDHVLFTMYQQGKIDVKTALEFADSKNDLQLKMRMEGGLESDTPNVGSVQF